MICSKCSKKLNLTFDVNIKNEAVGCYCIDHKTLLYRYEHNLNNEFPCMPNIGMYVDYNNMLYLVKLNTFNKTLYYLNNIIKNCNTDKLLIGYDYDIVNFIKKRLSII